MLVTMLVIVYSYEIFVCNVMCMLVPRFVLGQFECMTEHRPWLVMFSQKGDPIFFRTKWRKNNIPRVSILFYIQKETEKNAPPSFLYICFWKIDIILI